MSFFVISRGTWSLQPQEFVQQLCALWPTAVIREHTSPESSDCLDFELVMPHSEVTGALNREGRSLSLEADLRDAARLALWFRSLAPCSEPMTFCDEAMSGMLDLDSETTPTDIFQAFGYTPPAPGQMNYTLIPRGGWGMPVQELAQRMRGHWPSARVMASDAPDSRWSVEFHIPMAHSEVVGTVRRSVSAMVFTGDLRDCAGFALWCRSVVPTEELLLLCDQGHLRLESATTLDEVLQAFDVRTASPASRR
jgi:hypothetical protein